MDMASHSKVPKITKLAFVALGLTLIGNATISPCLALGLPSLSSQKKTALQYEVYSKLSTGAGPQTNDLQKQEPQLDSQALSKPVDLSPVTMDEGQKSDTSLGPSEEGVLKATVKSDHNVLPSGPVESAINLAPVSIKESVGEKALKRDASLYKNAEQVNAMPISLLPSNDEEDNKKDVKFSAEKIELADLWDSTLARSQDIQFVVQKLMPSKNTGKTANVMMKMLSATVFGGMSMMTMMAPNMGAQMGSNMGASMMMQALNGVQGANDKKAKLSQTEAIQLYGMVRATADKVVDKYNDYKIHLSALRRSTDILARFQDMLKDMHASQTPLQQITAQAELMKYQSAIETETEQVARYRQSLVDLSGSDAVAKLDKQLEIDRQKVDEAAVLTAGTQQKSDAPADQQTNDPKSAPMTAASPGAVTN
jgi:hypothetical protein